MGAGLFSKTLMALNFKKDLDRPALVDGKQDYPQRTTSGT
jgi:hypothetical protein